MTTTPRSLVLRTGAIAAVAAAFAACAHAPPPPAPTATTPTAPYTPGPPPPPPAPGPSSSRTMGPAPGSEQDFVINIGDRIYFGTDQYTVAGDGESILSKQADWLGRYPRVAVRIEGNCDERGTREYNLALGARRADAVKSFLVGRGVDPSRISTISYGKEHPVDPGAGEDAWAHNRNAHSAITAGAQQ